ILHPRGVVKTHGAHIPAVGHPGANAVATTEAIARPVVTPTNLHVNPANIYSYLPPYTPDQIKGAYGFDLVPYTIPVSHFRNIVLVTLPGDGTGQTIAIVDAYADATIKSDADTFDQGFAVSRNDSRSLYNAYGPSSNWLTIATPQGAPANAPAGWAAE